MGNSKLTLIGLYNYDDSIFDNMIIPSALNREDLKMNILLEAGEFEVLYSDFEFFKAAIGFWSKKNISVWDELYATTQYEYNPIENYDRKENRTNTQTRNLQWSDNETRNLADNNTETRNLVSTGSDTGTIQNDGSSDTDSTASRSQTTSGRAYNDSDLVSKESVSESSTGSEDVTTESTETRNLSSRGTDTGTVTNQATSTGTDNRAGTDTGTVGFTETANIHGNIGVMSTQQMIEMQRDVVKFNPMDYIINDFKHAFCVMKY